MPDKPFVLLRFDLDATLRLAEDAVAATEHRTRWDPTPDEPDRQVDAGPCLILVRDDGVYLMSTDKNAPTGADGRLPVCYAAGFDPRFGHWRSAWDRTGLPGDDFAEYLEVLDSGLLDDLRAAARLGFRWFVIGLSEEDLSISFQPGTPTKPQQMGRADEHHRDKEDSTCA